MHGYHQLHLAPDRPDGQPPADPDFGPFAEQRVRLRDELLRGFLADPDVPIHTMETELPGLGRVMIQMGAVEHTAALATISKLRPPAHPHMLIAAVMLGGFAAADEAALERMKTTPGFGGNPDLPVDVIADAARRGRRPLMVQVFGHAQCFEDPLLRTICDALGDAFFAQFGDAGAHPPDDGPSDLPHDEWVKP